MNAKELKQKVEDRAKVNLWLDNIEEFDPACRAEVIEQCSKDKEARQYYVSCYERDCHDK